MTDKQVRQTAIAFEVLKTVQSLFSSLNFYSYSYKRTRTIENTKQQQNKTHRQHLQTKAAKWKTKTAKTAKPNENLGEEMIEMKENQADKRE